MITKKLILKNTLLIIVLLVAGSSVFGMDDKTAKETSSQASAGAASQSHNENFKGNAKHVELLHPVQSVTGAQILAQQFYPEILTIIFSYILKEFSGSFYYAHKPLLEPGKYPTAHCLAALRDGRLAIGGNPYLFKIWDPKELEAIATVGTVDRTIWSAATQASVVSQLVVLQDGNVIFCHDTSSHIRKWNPADAKGKNIVIIGGKNVRGMIFGHGGIKALASLSNDTVVAAYDLDETIVQWNPNTSWKESDRFFAKEGEPMRCFTGHTGGVHSLQALAGGRFLSGAADNTIKLWDPACKAGQEVITTFQDSFSGYSGRITRLAALSEDRFVSGSADGSIKLWDLKTGHKLMTFNEHGNRVKSPDALPLAKVTLWRSLITNLIALPDNRFCSVLDGDGPAGEVDKSVKFWDPSNGNQPYQEFPHAGNLLCLIALPDGSLVGGNLDGAVKIWRRDAPSAIELATRAARFHQKQKIEQGPTQENHNQTHKNVLQAAVQAKSSKKNKILDTCVLS